MKVTIKDVSKAAGVSPATVSRVLTGSGCVNEITREKVQSAIQQLNYTYEQKTTAAVNSQKTILIVTGDTSSTFFQQFYHALRIALQRLEYVPLIAYSEYDEKEDGKYLAYAQEARMAGVIMVTPVDGPKMRKLLECRNIPTILVNRPFRSIDLNVICLDHYRAGYLAAQQLIKLKHENVMCVIGSGKSTSEIDKLAGFSDAYHDAGFTSFCPVVLEANYGRSAAYEICIASAEEIEGCTAAFVTNEQMTLGVIKAARRMKKNIPEDLSVIAVGAAPINDNELDVTTVMQNAAALGESTVKQLADLIEHPDAVSQKIYFPPSLQEGNSIRAL